jgi:hypothetical protein
MTARRLANRVRAAIRATLPPGLGVDVEPVDAVAPTFTVTVRAGRSEHRFIVGWAGEGWPADVERLAALARDLDVVVARDLSVGAREWLDEHDFGWVDETGRSNVSLPSGLVVTRETPIRRPRPPSTGWSRSTVAAAEAALSGVEPRVDEIQRATGLSRGATANALVFLERQGLLRRDTARGPASARRVADATALLEQYADAVAVLNAKVPAVLFHRLWSDPVTALVDEIAPALDRADFDWAVTGAVASHLLAPYLSNLAVLELYVDAELLEDRVRLGSVLDARVVERGHRIEVRPLPSPVTMVAGVVVEGVRCACAARVYADLRAKGGRFAEAANHLWEVVHAGTPA